MEKKPSPRRRAAGRINGRLAAGCKTPEGKAASSLNALKHGATAISPTITGESLPKFKALRRAYIDRFQPRDAYELDLVETMISCTWREHRLWDWESAILNIEIERQREKLAPHFDDPNGQLCGAVAFVEKLDDMERLSKYENRLDARFHRARKALMDRHKEHAIENVQNEGKSQNRTPENDPAAPAPAAAPPPSTPVIPPPSPQFVCIRVNSRPISLPGRAALPFRPPAPAAGGSPAMPVRQSLPPPQPPL